MERSERVPTGTAIHKRRREIIRLEKKGRRERVIPTETVIHKGRGRLEEKGSRKEERAMLHRKHPRRTDVYGKKEETHLVLRSRMRNRRRAEAKFH